MKQHQMTHKFRESECDPARPLLPSTPDSKKDNTAGSSPFTSPHFVPTAGRVGAPTTSLVEMIWDQMWYSIYRYPYRVKINRSQAPGPRGTSRVRG